MGKITLTFILALFLISLATAVPYKQNTEVDLKVPFEVDGEVASPSAVCNITIIYPNATTLREDASMDYNPGGIFNITLASTETGALGDYSWTASCCDGTYCASGYDNFLVTPSGTEPTTAQGIIYFIAMALVFIFFIMSLYGAIVLPWRNTRSEDGTKIISINDLKYLKMGLWYFSYLLLVFFLAITKGMVGDFLFENNLYVFMDTIYQIFLYLLWPVTIGALWITIYQVFADKKTYAFLSRGLSGR